MRRLAVFVEGQTEQLFIECLIKEVAGASSVTVTKAKFLGGAKFPRKLRVLTAAHKKLNTPYYVLIYDCGTDNRVNSDIRDQYESLKNKGYDAIIGVRDVYPDFTRKDIPKLQSRLHFGVRTKPIVPSIILAVMEVEAWFLAEATHLSRLPSPVSTTDVYNLLGFDPSKDDVEDRNHPAEDLEKIHSLGGLAYKKNKSAVQQIVDNFLDYGELYCNVQQRVPSLSKLFSAIESFLSKP